MSRLLFIAQTMLDSLVDGGQVDFQGDAMVLVGGDGKARAYGLDPAVRFVRVEGSEADPHDLVGRVKSDAQLRKLGAESLGDSVVLGETAYEVQPGFLAQAAGAEVTAPFSAEDRLGAQPPGDWLPQEREEKRKEAESLARFLLENLS